MYIEYLTNKLSLNAWTLFQEIEANGGWLKAVQSNFIQDRIEKNAANKTIFRVKKNTSTWN